MYSPVSLVKLSANNVLKLCKSRSLKNNTSIIYEINNLNNEIFKSQTQITTQRDTIKQFNLDKEELKFLRLNLVHGHKCRKTFLNSKGFIVGTSEYKKCVLNKE